MTWLLSLLPAPWLAALKAVPWRLVGFIAASIVAAWLWILVGHWHEDSLTLPRVVAQAKADASKAAQVLESTRTAYRAAQTASEGYQRELQQIASRPGPVGPVRLCIPARRSVPAAGPAPGGSGPAVPATGVVPSGDAADLDQGQDIGPDLAAYAARCEQVSAQGRAIQGLSQSR